MLARRIPNVGFSIFHNATQDLLDGVADANKTSVKVAAGIFKQGIEYFACVHNCRQLKVLKTYRGTHVSNIREEILRGDEEIPRLENLRTRPNTKKVELDRLERPYRRQTVMILLLAVLLPRCRFGADRSLHSPRLPLPASF